jgi:HJR/Mrr/RecB family endonuclease
VEFLYCLISILISAVIVIAILAVFKIGPFKPKPKQDASAAYYEKYNTLAKIRSMAPVEFEYFIKSLFERMGYTVQTTAITGDKGVDLFVTKNNRLSVVQCKRFSGTVGAPIVRDLYGTMLHELAASAYLVTTGTISLPAQTWADGKPIHLVDGNGLLEWIESFPLKEVEPSRDQTAQEIVKIIDGVRLSDRLNQFYLQHTRQIIITAFFVIAIVFFMCGCLTGGTIATGVQPTLVPTKIHTLIK